MNVKIINFLIALKNASISKKKMIIVTKKKMMLDILALFYEEGYLESFSEDRINNKIIIYLKYSADSEGLLNSLKIISKPSKFIYLNYSSICQLSNRRKLFVISTSFGLKSSFSCKKTKLGGHLLFNC